MIQLFMPGGPSQVDTFDYKPIAKSTRASDREIVDRKSLRNTKMGLMPSPYRFKQYGESGKWVSEIFPHAAQLVDDICFIHSMHTDIPEHAGAMMMMNAGHLQPSRPSMGSWLVYGLGTENDDLPGFIAMSPRAQPRNKLANWGNAFLPGPTPVPTSIFTRCSPIGFWRTCRTLAAASDQREQADLLTRLNQIDLERQQQDGQLEASIQAMEMAFRMQFAVPDAFDTTRNPRRR